MFKIDLIKKGKNEVIKLNYKYIIYQIIHRPLVMNWEQASSSVRRTKVRSFVAAVLYVSLGHSFLVSLRITDNYFWLLLAPSLSHREAGRWPQAAEMSPLRKRIIISFFLDLRLGTFDIQSNFRSFFLLAGLFFFLIQFSSFGLLADSAVYQRFNKFLKSYLYFC